MGVVAEEILASCVTLCGDEDGGGHSPHSQCLGLCSALHRGSTSAPHSGSARQGLSDALGAHGHQEAGVRFEPAFLALKTLC